MITKAWRVVLCMCVFAVLCAGELLHAGNIALNAKGLGFPNPTSSSVGWGGGTNPYSINDGLREYSHWANGLAFTGGHNSVDGGQPWVEPAGLRQATIDFGRSIEIGSVLLFHHGDEHVPAQPDLEYFHGGRWEALEASRRFGDLRLVGSNSGGSVSDEYTFAPVTASAVRYSFDNSGKNILGSLNVHGWIYEMEVYEAIPEPGAIVLAVVGIAVLVAARMRIAIRSFIVAWRGGSHPM